MKSAVLSICLLSGILPARASGGAERAGTDVLVQNFCIRCHDTDTETALNFDELASDLSDTHTFRQWEQVYDRVHAGEMPPASEPQPGDEMVDAFLSKLKLDLRAANLAVRSRHGRVPARRLSRREFDHTIRDLLGVEGDFASLLPEENQAGSFDTVGSSQHFTGLHLESCLRAADMALDRAIRLGANPVRRMELDLLNSDHLNDFHEKEIRLGGNISRKLQTGVALFRDVDYLVRSDLLGFKVRAPGIYRISGTAEVFQSTDPVTLKVVVKDVSGLSRLVGVQDLMPGETHTFDVRARMDRTKVFYATMAEERAHRQILADIIDSGGAANYEGKGIVLRSLQIEGPLTEGWPPQSTRDILCGVRLAGPREDGTYEVELDKPILDHVSEIVSRFARRAFRRPLAEHERKTFVSLAKPAIADGRSFADVIRLPLRAILSSPQFLMLTGRAGPLDDYALASRLSFFLWKSLPDEELLSLAERGQLCESDVLSRQVDRMLDDDRSERFIGDFLAQWLRLDEIDDTAPDERLYPEYDEVLHWSIRRETESFFRELIAANHGISSLIDSNFVLINRRLATHYGIEGVTGQHMQKVSLPEGSPRGGILGQASILKVTANGLVTSPVRRGDFVLSDFLGTPPPRPPDGVGSIEPDVTGVKSIRDTLKQHRSDDACGACHQKIDPPGLALECFDPIGGYRTHYRSSFHEIFSLETYREGPAVDTGGVTPDGEKFEGIRGFRRLLLEQRHQLARHFVSRLIVYSTGGEIEFADREELDRILNRTRQDGYPVRSIIHEVVQSQLFRNR